MWTNPEIPVRILLFFQNKNIERNNECIDFEDFDQDKIERSIEVSRRGSNTFYPCARGT